MQKITMVHDFLNPPGSSLSSALFLRVLLWPSVSTSETLPPPASAPDSHQVAVAHYENVLTRTRNKIEKITKIRTLPLWFPFFIF